MSEAHSNIFTFFSADSGLSKIVNLNNSPAVVIVFVLSFLLLGIVIKNTKYNYIQNIKNLFASTKYSQKFNTTKNDLSSQIIIWILSLLGFSLFFVLSFNFFNQQGTTFAYYMQGDFVKALFLKTGITFVATGLFVLLQRQLLTFVFWLFSVDDNDVELIFNFCFLIIQLLGIVLFITSFLFLYVPFSWQGFTLYFGLTIIFVAAILPIIYCIEFFFNKLALFYFFLYLCTIEILPVLVLKKLLAGAYKIV